MDFGGRNRNRHCKQNSVWMPFGARQRNLWYLELCPCQGGGFKMNQTSFIFTPSWGNDPIWRAYFSNGLVQPPTRFVFTCLFWVNPHFPLAGKEQTIYTCPCWASRFNLDSPLASLLALVHPTQNTENIYTHTHGKSHTKKKQETNKNAHILDCTSISMMFSVFLFSGKVSFTLHHCIRPWNVGQAAKVPWRCFAVRGSLANQFWLVDGVDGLMSWLVNVGWLIGWLVDWLVSDSLIGWLVSLGINRHSLRWWLGQ